MARDIDPIFLEKRIYALEKNIPSIENVPLKGNKTFEELNIASAEDVRQINDDLLELREIVNGLINS